MKLTTDQVKEIKPETHCERLLRKRKPMPAETKRKIGLANSIASKGHIPWNKGKSGYSIHTEEEKEKRRARQKQLYKEGKLPQLKPMEKGVHHHTEKTKLLLGLLNKGRVISEKTRALHRLHMSGERNHNWKGGISHNQLRGRGNSEWDNIRKQVYKRDGYRCQICKQKGHRLSAHHIIPYRYCKHNDISNLISVCVKCHRLIEVQFDKQYQTIRSRIEELRSMGYVINERIGENGCAEYQLSK